MSKFKIILQSPNSKFVLKTLNNFSVCAMVNVMINISNKIHIYNLVS